MFKQVGESAVKQKGGASANDPVNSTLDQAWTLKIGDQISLWAETDDDGVPVHVYLSASGVSSQMVQVCGDNVQKYDTPKNFKGKLCHILLTFVGEIAFTALKKANQNI